MSAFVFDYLLQEHETTLCFVIRIAWYAVESSRFQIEANKLANVLDKPSFDLMHSLPGYSYSFVAMVLFLANVKIEYLRKSLDDIGYNFSDLFLVRVRVSW